MDASAPTPRRARLRRGGTGGCARAQLARVPDDATVGLDRIGHEHAVPILEPAPVLRGVVRFSACKVARVVLVRLVVVLPLVGQLEAEVEPRPDGVLPSRGPGILAACC